MKLLAIFVLATATLSNAFVVRDDYTDKEMFLRIIQCAQHAIIVGIPEFGIPSHNPLLISSNFSYSGSLGNYEVEVDLENMYMEGIPWWNVTQMDDVTEIEGIPVFDYAIYWKLISFTGTLRVEVIDTEAESTLLKEEAEFGFEFDHITFSGEFNFTKPEQGREPGFNKLDLHFDTEESKIHVDGFGVLSNLIELIGGPLLTSFVNSDLTASVGPAIKDKLNRDWVGKPERIQALIDYCDSTLVV